MEIGKYIVFGVFAFIVGVFMVLVPYDLVKAIGFGFIVVGSIAIIFEVMSVHGGQQGRN